MARKVKCQYCEKTTDNPFKGAVGSKILNYCNEEEYKTDLEEKESYRKILESCNEILGYKTFNSVIGKEIKELHQSYSYKEIYVCIDKYKKDIILYMDLKDIEKEYNKIRYMFTVIKNNIADVSLENKKIERKEEKMNMIEFDMFDYKYKEQKSDNFLELLEG